MSAVARRLLAAFVEPLPATGAACSGARGMDLAAVRREAVALVGHPSVVVPAAAATALLASVGPVAGAPRAPATPGAARAAARLRDRGHSVTACGRLVRLAGDPADVMRAAAVAGAPAVVAVGTPRGEPVDRLLGAQDAVLVAAGGDRAGLVPLALAGLAPLGIPCAVAPAAPDAVSAALAVAGIAVRGRWAAGLRAALESAA